MPPTCPIAVLCLIKGPHHRSVASNSLTNSHKIQIFLPTASFLKWLYADKIDELADSDESAITDPKLVPRWISSVNYSTSMSFLSSFETVRVYFHNSS